MRNQTTGWLAAAVAATAAAVIALGWFGDETSSSAVTLSPTGGASASAGGPQDESGTSIRAAAAADPLLTPALIPIFERILSEAAAPSKEAFMAVAPGLLAKELAPEFRVRALGLLERYVDMLEAMQGIESPAPKSGMSSMRQILDAREAVRRRYFSPEEFEGIFGDLARQDANMAEKLEINSNASMTPKEREQAIRASESTYLSPEQLAVRQEAVAHVDIQRDTDALDARGASAQERFNERAARYGYEAARGLASLDAEKADWNQRLDKYANAPAADQENLRASLFSETERLRLDGALGLRAMNATIVPATR